MLEFILDIIYPKTCNICNKYLETNKYFCLSCWRKIELIRQGICYKCGHPFGEGIKSKNDCYFCKNKKFYFSETRSAGKYEGNLKNTIINFKYNNARYLKTPLAYMILNMLKKHPFSTLPEIVIPVPLHTSKKYKRGYNQSELISKIISKKINAIHYEDAIIKIKKTKSQSSLKKNERSQNVKNVFEINPIFADTIKGKYILLIDDILTTGNTASECAKILKKIGAQKIFLATIAKTM